MSAKGTPHQEGPSEDKQAGRKTPGRIQWIDESGMGGKQSPVHILDPDGRNPEAFDALAHALEKYRCSTPAASPLSKIHYYSPRPAITKESGSEDRQSDRHQGGSSSDEATLAETSLPTGDLVGAPIYEDEDAGLPRSRDSRWYANRQAERIVHTHTRRIGKAEPTQSRLPVGLQLPKISETSARDSEDNAIEGTGEGGKGILSTLLKLYEPSSSDYASYVSSTSASGRESPIGDNWDSDSHLVSTRPSDQDEDTHRDEREGRGRFDDKARKRSRIPRPRLTIPSLGLVARHPKARTGGGVFGPLIAATGSLGGVAAPYHTKLQPNLTRPGYGLSRYSADNETPIPPPPAVKRSKSDTSIELHRFSASMTDTPDTPPPSLKSPEDEGQPKKEYWWPNLSRESFYPGRRSGRNTPMSFMFASDCEYHDYEKQLKKKSKKRKRTKDEVFITKHVAQIIQREEFILKLTRAMMMFGGPSHRLQFQIQSAARVLDINLSFLYLPDVALISFDDLATGTSHIKLIRQPSSLDLDKLTSAFHLYWKVIHDKLSVSNASKSLDALMRKPPLYNWWQVIIFGGMCSSWICTVSFAGSFLDALVSFPLGAFLVAIQILSVRNILYSYVFEITITMFSSFIAAALASTRKFCYSAVASSAVVLILPGFLVLTASLELTSRNIVSGSVRICYAIAYALFLGFGFTMGADLFQIFTGHAIYGSEDYVCTATHHPNGPWYQRTPDKLWALLTVPMFSTFMSLKNQARWNQKEFVVLVSIACVGWVTNYFTGLRFPGQSDIIAAVGAFTVGIVANVYARIFSGNAFVVMITGILLQLPSGLGTGGLLSYATEQASGSTTSYLSGFEVSLKLVSVAIGLAIGLAISLAVTYPIQSKKREAGIFSL